MAAIQRIIEYIEYKGISKYKFYQTTGLSNGFLDKGSNIGSDKCAIILSHYPDLNPTWLVMGEGEMLLNEKEIDKADDPGVEYKKKTPYLPIEAMAGSAN